MTVGRLIGGDIDIEDWKGGKCSYWPGGGGGKDSFAEGEFELCRISELREGENIPRGGMKVLIGVEAHG